MDYNPPGSCVHGILQQEYWSGLPCPPPGDLPLPEIEPSSSAAPTLQADSFTSELPGKRVCVCVCVCVCVFMYVCMYISRINKS